MKHIFTQFRLEVVKEKSGLYEVEKYVKQPDVIYDIAVNILGYDKLPEEVFSIVTLNNKNKVTGLFEVSRGTLSAALIHPREVFKRAILMNANSIILMHNHPSGDPQPSQEDIKITERLVEAGNILGVKVLDHIIIGDNLDHEKYVSFNADGRL